MYDVIVIGGGPAGLQAALTLGRVHRSCLVLDSGHYRNDPAAEMHNFISRDGTPPAELRAAARAELAAYDTVEVRTASVTAVEADDDGVRVRTEDGAVHEARRLLLATGMADSLPEVPGCPSCGARPWRTARSATATSSPAAPWRSREARTPRG